MVLLNQQVRAIFSKHHLINNISVTDDYDISQFQSDAREKINNVFKMKDFAIMVGGSGLYINSVLYGIVKSQKLTYL